MEAMQQYYRLMKSILFVLFLSFGIISCEKEDPVSTSPNTRQTDNTDPTDLQSPNQKIPDRKTKCVIKTHINIKQNVIFGAKLKPV